MIPEFIKKEATTFWQTEDWQDELKNLISHPENLGSQLGLSSQSLAAIALASHDFPVRIPEGYLKRIQLTDINHPLLKQFIPSAEELNNIAGFSQDPVEEVTKNPAPGLVHKYRGRVLLIVSSSCPVHCRYCFRRHFPYNTNRNSREQWRQALDYIRNDSSIREVIYSGGDPLSAPDHQLAWLSSELAAIPHLERLRVHTRFPIVIPQRVTDDLLRWLSTGRLLPSMVLHSNHPDELGTEVAQALTRLRTAGVTLLNQSVLLKGVNDNPATLISLSEKLYRCGVLPYYLHLLDKVKGAAHFDVPEADALAIYEAIKAELPGYLLPKLVREEAGKTSKTILSKIS
jgi:EF-P beta-lysylation protein EpmB